jgi:hypothetical protein
MFEGIVHGEFYIHGFQNSSLRTILPEKSGSQISRMFKRLRVHSMIKKIGGTYRYYITHLGQKTVLTALILRTMFIIRSLGETVAPGI